MGKYSEFTRHHFASMLTYYRERAGLNRMELAKRIGVAPSTITCYEQADREPKIETYNSLAQVLKIDPIQFFISDKALELLTGDDSLFQDKEEAVSGDKDALIAYLSDKMKILSGEELMALNTLIDVMARRR